MKNDQGCISTAVIYTTEQTILEGTKRLLYELPFLLSVILIRIMRSGRKRDGICPYERNLSENRHRYKTLICFHSFLPTESQCILLQSQKLFCLRVFLFDSNIIMYKSRE